MRTFSILRTIKYKRHEFSGNPRSYQGTLLTFGYDIPHLPACGILPPPHILNQVFSSGGGDGGMSPGASWEPFTITAKEYKALKKAVVDTPVSDRTARSLCGRSVKFDDEFDSIEGNIEWMMAICKKHRETWHARLEDEDE